MVFTPQEIFNRLGRQYHVGIIISIAPFKGLNFACSRPFVYTQPYRIVGQMEHKMPVNLAKSRILRRFVKIKEESRACVRSCLFSDSDNVMVLEIIIKPKN
jgi:hypothetical protein